MPRVKWSIIVQGTLYKISRELNNGILDTFSLVDMGTKLLLTQESTHALYLKFKEMYESKNTKEEEHKPMLKKETLAL